MCQVLKPFSEFHKHRGRPDGHATYCKACKKDYNARHYESTKDTYNPQRAETRRLHAEAVNQLIREHMEGASCTDCGNTDRVVLEFDHVRGVKKFNIGDAKTQTLTAVVEELLKCEVVCANCHRHRTYDRAGILSWRN